MTLNHVIHHFDKKDNFKMLKNSLVRINKVLKPGGGVMMIHMLS